MRRYTGKCVIFLGIEQRLRKEEMEEQFSREVTKGWRFAADGARITDDNAGTEECKHTSEGVFVAVDSNLVVVVGAEEGATDSTQETRGRITQAWVNVRGGLRVSSVFLDEPPGEKFHR